MITIQSFDELIVGDLYTFPYHFQFLFSNKEQMLKSWKDTFEDAITTKIPDLVAFNADMTFFKFLNAENAAVCKTGSAAVCKTGEEMFLIDSYEPFVILEKFKTRQKKHGEYDATYTRMNIIILKILIEEKTFWCGFDEQLFEQDVIFGYSDQMIGKTHETSYAEMGG
jgi:hypothetical protein